MEFDYRDVITIATGRLVSPTGMDGVHKILNFLTGEDLFSHQLPRAQKAAEPYLLEMYPELAHVDTTILDELKDVQNTAIRDGILEGWCWGVRIKANLPKMIDLEPLANGMYVYKDPIQEAIDLKGKENVVLVHLDTE